MVSMTQCISLLSLSTYTNLIMITKKHIESVIYACYYHYAFPTQSIQHYSSHFMTEIVPNAGHFLPLTHPDECFQLIHKFIHAKKS